MNTKAIFIWIICANTVPCLARAITVDDDGPADFATIQEAVDDCNDGDVILIKDGTYTGDGNRDIEILDKSITIQSENGPENCIIDCEASDTDNHRAIFYDHNGDKPLTVIGLTIKNGYSNSGAAIYAHTYVTLRNCIFKKNQCFKGSGGAVSIVQDNISQDSIVLEDCTFLDNKASDGGGLYVDCIGSLELISCRFLSNTAGCGGGMHSKSLTLKITDSIFEKNISDKDSGALYGHCIYGNAILSNCVFNRNQAYYGSPAATILSDNMQITNCTFHANYAERGDGALAIECRLNPAIIENCILWANEPEQLSASKTEPQVTYCDIQGGWPGEGNIDADPCFVYIRSAEEPSVIPTDNLRLIVNSPCIDAGTNSPELTDTDIDGNPRIVGNTVDMGAYEGAQQSFLVHPLRIYTHEGQTATLSIALTMQPVEAVQVSISVQNETDDIQMQSPSELLFSIENYSTAQTVTILANHDVDNINEKYVLYISSPDVQPVFTIIAVEDDDVARTILYVDESASGINTGDNWQRAYRHLQDALHVAEDNNQVSEIRIAQGIYRPDQGLEVTEYDRHVSFQIREGLHLIGGFAGGTQPDPNLYDPNLFPTILSGDLRENDALMTDPCDYYTESTREDNSIHVIVCRDIVNTNVFEGLIITAGHANFWDLYLENDESAIGGGLFCNNASPTIKNCVFIDNCGSSGGGIYNLSGSPVMLDCTFIRNSAIHSGGAVYNRSCIASLNNCRFEDNYARNSGGGICNVFSVVNFNKCVFINNSSSKGGSVANTFETANESKPNVVMFNHCLFDHNQAFTRHLFGSYYYGQGGVFYADYKCEASFSDCAFTENMAPEGGAIHLRGHYILNTTGIIKMSAIHCIFMSNSTTTNGGAILVNGSGQFELDISIEDCNFIENSADNCGGAVCNQSLNNASTDTTIERSNFERNSAVFGGAVCNNTCGSSNCFVSVTHRNNRFINNRASYGGAIFNQAAASYYGTATIETVNCLFSGNTALQGGAVMGNSEYLSTLTTDVTNCTFFGNIAQEGTALLLESINTKPQSTHTITNSILWQENSLQTEGNTVLNSTHCDILGGWPGEGNLDIDPCFAVSGYWDSNDTPEDSNDDFWVDGDYHLKSQTGRWDPNTGSWVQDEVTSICIDAGCPDSDWSEELWPHGGIINMGAYGGTPQASMSLSTTGDIADINNDGVIDIFDLQKFSYTWLTELLPLAGDIDRNGTVDFLDFAAFMNYWKVNQ